MYSIKQVAKLSGVSVRTLHYYDELGLLVPAKQENGYRLYSEDDLDILQHILFYRELAVPLKQIIQLLAQPQTRLEVLLQQQQLLQQQHQRLTQLIDTIEQTIRSEKGVSKMTAETKFQGFKKIDMVQYEAEARAKYGDEVVEESQRRQQSNEAVDQAFNQIFERINQVKELDVTDTRVQAIVKDYFDVMRRYAFDCTVEQFRGIGQLFLNDERFRHNLNQFGDGTAEFLSAAMQVFEG